MKLSFLFLFLFFSINSWSKEITIKVNGMVCSMCIQGIEKKFSKVSQVKELKVDLDNKLINIQTKDNLDIEDDQIHKLITEAGYSVVGIERK